MYTVKHLNKILEEVTIDYYQKGIKKNLLQRLWHHGKLNIVKKLIDFNPNKVLDVGCASGWFLNELLSSYPSSKFFGVDAYKQAINYGKKKYKKLVLTHADAHSLPFNNNTFDLVICTEVLEHVVHPDKVLKEIKRILRRNGIGIIEMDSGNWLFTIVWYWWTHIKNGVWKHAHLHIFNTNKLNVIIKQSGLRIIKKHFFNFGMAVVFKVKKI